MKTPKELDAVVDAILSYKPKPKTKAAKRRVRREKRAAKKRGLGLMYIIPNGSLQPNLNRVGDFGTLRKECSKMATDETSALPPDPEGQNDDRACWAEVALDAFQQETGTEDEDALSDLLTDLMHYCDRNGIQWADELARASRNYREETAPTT